MSNPIPSPDATRLELAVPANYKVSCWAWGSLRQVIDNAGKMSYKHLQFGLNRPIFRQNCAIRKNTIIPYIIASGSANE